MEVEQVIKKIKEAKDLKYVGDITEIKDVEIELVGKDDNEKIYDLKNHAEHERWLIDKSPRRSGKSNWALVELMWGKELEKPVSNISQQSSMRRGIERYF